MAIPADPIQFWAAVGAIGALVAAVGTVVAIAIAFVQIFAEQSARRADRRLEQARKVSAWVGGTSPEPISEPPPGGTTDEIQLTATVLNASDTPIYRVVVWPVLVDRRIPARGEDWRGQEAPGLPTAVAVVPPGRWVMLVAGGWWQGMMRRPGIEVAFTDAAGRHWVRRVTGQLEELRTGAVEHYGLSQPVDWVFAEPSTS